MKKQLPCMIAVVFALRFVNPVTASPTVIAGSEGVAPPSFWDNSFWGITATIDRAFPFVITPGTPSSVEQLQIAAFRYAQLGGSTAVFAIHHDAAGIPGSEIGRFHFSSIPTVAGVLTASPAGEIVLYPDTPYWIMGSTPSGQVNWNLADSVFGRVAYRVGDAAWTTIEYGNVSAFAILGSPAVPEPTALTMYLAAVASTCLLRIHLRRHSGS